MALLVMPPHCKNLGRRKSLMAVQLGAVLPVSVATLPHSGNKDDHRLQWLLVSGG